MSEPVLTVHVHCDRTGQRFTLNVPVSKYPRFVQLNDAKRRNAEKLQRVLQDMGEEAPDMLLHYNGTFVAFPQVVIKSSRMLLRCLNEITKSDLFPYEIRRRNKKTPE